MKKNTRIFVAGHRGMVGSAIVRALQASSRAVQIVTRSHDELDLIDQHAVRQFFAQEDVDQVYLAAAKVGGIHANNTFPAQFVYENLMIEANVIHEAWRAGVDKLLFLGSSCIYPRLAEQPMAEAALLTGPLEPTNEPYAIARSPESSYVKAITGSMELTSAASCHRICTVRAIIITRKTAMSSRR